MNKYSWGSMMDDYVYLEDCGRQVSEWAKKSSKARMTQPHKRSFKRQSLQSHLESMDIHMELAPTGMLRQSINRSVFQQKSHSPLLTIGYTVNGPKSSKTYDFVTHMNPIDQSLRSLITTKLLEAKAEKHPPWVVSIIQQNATSSNLVFCIKSIQREIGRSYEYCRLEGDKPLSEILRGTSFVEFPQIEVYRKEDVPFQIHHRADVSLLEGPVQKRRKMETDKTRPELQSLVQYDDSQSSGSESDVATGNAMNAVNGYADDSSDSEPNDL